MVRLFGGFKSKNKKDNNSKHRRRLIATARTPELLRERHAMFRYAVNEYAQTVEPGTSSNNDDGHLENRNISQAQQALNEAEETTSSQAGAAVSNAGSTTSQPYNPPLAPGLDRPTRSHDDDLQQQQHAPSSFAGVRSAPAGFSGSSHEEQEVEQIIQQPQHQPQHHLLQPSSTTSSSSSFPVPPSSSEKNEGQGLTHPSFDSMRVEPSLSLRPDHAAQQQQQQQSSSMSSSIHHRRHHHPDSLTQRSGRHSQSSQQANSPSTPPPPPAGQQQQQQHYASSSIRSRFEDELPLFSYEEHYGDAYTGAPLKYVYPSGYQSMRPRSAPWRLSVMICLLFTWLSVFIVGHCSDQTYANADYQSYYADDADDNAADNNNSIDDDSLVIEIRWCGSRPLYLMWVASMLITGLAAAYCSVIGYIKCRDFAVANARSQPATTTLPGNNHGDDYGKSNSLLLGRHNHAKSDYYVSLQSSSQFHNSAYSNNNAYYRYETGSDSTYQSSTGGGGGGTHRPTIYQSDGTPQFWGSHIYRPTQAAVAVTSR